MSLKSLRRNVETWRQAGLLDAETAEGIVGFEENRRQDSGTSLAQILALGLGGLLLTAGVLLFVAAHWDELSPTSRFGLVLALVVVAHSVAVWRRSPPALPVVLHAVGTGFFGAGIFLAGQVFNLSAHWPAALMLWAGGAAAAWWLLRQWPQALWLAALVPVWLAGEYAVRFGEIYNFHAPMWGGLLIFALSYLTLKRLPDPILATVLRWAGWVFAIPFAAFTIEGSFWKLRGDLSNGSQSVAWLACLAVPWLLDAALRRRPEWRLALFGGGAWLLSTTSGAAGGSLWSEFWHQLGGYLLGAAMALGMAWWGVAARRPERVNLGVLAFGFVVLVYYFSNVMDKFSRSLSMLSLGALFFLLAFALGKVRRRLLAEIRPAGDSL